MKIVLEGSLYNLLREAIDNDMLTLDEINEAVAKLNRPKKRDQRHYSIWVSDGDGIYHCLVCDAAVFRDDPDELTDTCPCCGAHMISPKSRCDKRGGKR